MSLPDKEEIRRIAETFLPLPNSPEFVGAASLLLMANFGEALANSLRVNPQVPKEAIARSIFKGQLGPHEGLLHDNQQLWREILESTYIWSLTACMLNQEWLKNTEYMEQLKQTSDVSTETLRLALYLEQQLGEILFENFRNQQLPESPKLEKPKNIFAQRLAKAKELIANIIDHHLPPASEEWTTERLSSLKTLLELLTASFDPENKNGWQELIKFQAKNDLPIVIINNGNKSFEPDPSGGEFAEIRIGFRTHLTEACNQSAHKLTVSALNYYKQLTPDVKESIELPVVMFNIAQATLGYNISFCEAEELAPWVIINLNIHQENNLEKAKILEQLFNLDSQSIKNVLTWSERYLIDHEMGHAIAGYLFQIINKKRSEKGLPKLSKEGHLTAIDEFTAEILSLTLLAKFMQETNSLDEKNCTALLYGIIIESLEYLETNSASRKDSGSNYYYSELAIIRHLVNNGYLSIGDINGESSIIINNPVEAITSFAKIWQDLWQKLYNPKLSLDEIAQNIYPTLKEILYPPKETAISTFLQFCKKQNRQEIISFNHYH